MEDDTNVNDYDEYDQDDIVDSIVGLHSRDYSYDSFVSASEFDNEYYDVNDDGADVLSTTARSHSSALSGSPPPHTSLPLEQIGFESSEFVVAQERSTIKALKRISLDASATSDPDLPTRSQLSTSPPSPLTGFPIVEEPALDQPLLWVPAHLHPELAPRAWQSFVHERVSEIQHRSAAVEDIVDLLQVPSPRTLDSGLARRKSNLSREIHATGGSVAGFEDGADALQSKIARTRSTEVKVSDLEWLEEHFHAARESSTNVSLPEGTIVSDGPTISPLPTESGLRRSQHTSTRNRSTNRSGSRTETQAQCTSDLPSFFYEDESELEPAPTVLPSQVTVADGRLQLNIDESDLGSLELDPDLVVESVRHTADLRTSDDSTHSSTSSTGSTRTHAPSMTSTSSSVSYSTETTPTRHSYQQQQRSPALPRPQRVVSRKPLSPAPTSGPNTRSDSLCIVPVLDSPGSPSKSHSPSSSPLTLKQRGKALTAGFGRLFVSEKEKDKEYYTDSDRSPVKSSSFRKLNFGSSAVKPTFDETQREPTRRATIEYDRPLLQSTSETKKDKESVLSNLFGAKKKLNGQPLLKRKTPALVRKSQSSASISSARRSRSPSPPVSPVRKQTEQDQAYYYARFPLHIERAIYRLSHLKLANPHRPLCQQVLLSNFMYGYLELINQDSIRNQQHQVQYQQYQYYQQQQQNHQQQNQPQYQQQYLRHQQQQRQAYLYQQQQQQYANHQQQYYASQQPLMQPPRHRSAYGADETMFSGQQLKPPPRSSSRRSPEFGQDDEDDAYWHDMDSNDEIYEIYFDQEESTIVPAQSNEFDHAPDRYMHSRPPAEPARQQQHPPFHVAGETYYETIERQQREQEHERSRQASQTRGSRHQVLRPTAQDQVHHRYHSANSGGSLRPRTPAVS
ncbi:hypothetical protein V1512DRAFT_233970 [Lipomyces arxii]|uniref:uncharacterized protein n=1 Tax=Lipomyces arxii TaxID=56418 RepID=UPI0034CF12EA